MMETIFKNDRFHSIRINNQFYDVSQKDIDELLNIYPQPERVIKNCKYSNGRLLAELIEKDASYISVASDYYTASQLVLAISQMGYIITGMMIKDKHYSYIDCFFYESFLSKIKKLECYYTKFNMAFKKKILKRERNIIEMIATEARFYPNRKQLIGNLKINVGDSFFAETQLLTLWW